MDRKEHFCLVYFCLLPFYTQKLTAARPTHVNMEGHVWKLTVTEVSTASVQSVGMDTHVNVSMTLMKTRTRMGKEIGTKK